MFDKLDSYEVHATNRDPDRELKTLGSIGLLKQYFWPTSKVNLKFDPKGNMMSQIANGIYCGCVF